METPTIILPIAALVHAGHGEGDSLLADFAFDLRARGWRVHGLVQAAMPDAQHEKQIELVDIHSGQHFPLFQNLGSGSDACSVDTNSIAAASASLRTAIAQRAELTVVNRFGALEAAGGGFSIELLALMGEMIPVLTLTTPQYLDAWRHFTGSRGVELPLRRKALEQWFATIHPAARHAQQHDRQRHSR